MNYYLENHERILARFDEEVRFWIESLTSLFGTHMAEGTVARLRTRYAAFLSSIPFIGGDDNSRTLWLLDAARFLVFYQEFRNRLSSLDIGHVLFEAIMLRQKNRGISFCSESRYTPEQVSEYRKKMAAKSQVMQYPGDYVYEYVVNGEDGFGYNFTECGAYKLFKANDAMAFLPYFCYLDFPKMMNSGLSLSRTKTMSTGADIGNHRFRHGSAENVEWPPPFAPLGGRTCDPTDLP